jgi:hypothetical protein
MSFPVRLAPVLSVVWITVVVLGYLHGIMPRLLTHLPH